jgi:hypothetical protein
VRHETFAKARYIKLGKGGKYADDSTAKGIALVRSHALTRTRRRRLSCDRLEGEMLAGLGHPLSSPG